MIDSLLTHVKQFFCAHNDIVKRRSPIADTDLYRLYTECLDCGKESPGIETGGFTFNNC